MVDSIQKALEAVLEQLGVEVDQEALFEFRELEIADDLGFVEGVDLIHALEFQQEGFRHNDVHAIGAIYRHALVFKSERSLPAEGNFLKFEFPAQAGLIGGLQQSGAKRLVNFHGATDDLGNKRVVF